MNSKMTKVLKTILVFILVLALNDLYASPKNENVGKGKIAGKVIDAENKPVEFANIVLFRTSDTAMITGVITDNTGRFELTGIENGNYYLMVSFIGYEDKVIKDIQISPQNRNVILADISMAQSSTQLDGVEVVAERNYIEYKIDRKVINVSQDPNAAGGTLVEVLENTPSVDVDIEGNVTIRGSSNFKVLINGKPSMMDGQDVLQTTPADAVENIEIITNPSAKYDPEGDAGIINIVMKKNWQQGLNGMINASISSGNKYQGYALLNYKHKRINYYISVESIHRQFINNGEIYRRLDFYNDESGVLDSSNYLQTYIENVYGLNDFEIRGGVDISLTGKNTLSFQARYKDYPHRFHFESEYDEWGVDGLHYLSGNESDLVVEGRPVRFSITDVHSFDDKGHELQLYFFAGKKIHVNTQDMVNWDDNGESTFSKRVNDNPQINLEYDIDYVKPFNENRRLELGYSGRAQPYEFNHEAKNFDAETQTWIRDDFFSYKMDYNIYLNAVYATYTDEVWGLGYMVGLRAEHIYREILLPHINEEYIYDKLSLFPSAYISKKINDNQQVQASYSRRINRHNQWQLSPIPFYADQYTVLVGNPDLKPEYIDSYELRYQHSVGKQFFTVEGYYRYIDDSYYHVQEVDSNGIYYRIPYNLTDETVMGMEFSTDLKFTDWLEADIGVDLHSYSLNGNIADTDIDQKDENWRIRSTLTCKFKTNTRLQFRVRYRAPSKSVQGERNEYFVTGFAARQELLDKKLTLTFRIQDIFKTRRFERTAYGKDFYSVTRFTPEAPIFTFHVSYKINNYRSRRNDDNVGGGEGGFIF